MSFINNISINNKILTMKYKGYYTVVEYDTFDKIYHGKIADIKHLVSFHSETEEGLQAAFEEAVDDYLNLTIEL